MQDMDRSDRGGAIRKARRLLVATLIAVAVGEIGMRLYYWDGTSFGTHWGPLVERFERDFRFNRFDGPSRGPETSGHKAPGAVRILVQGDSITWGQGVKREADLYTSRAAAKSAGLRIQRGDGGSSLPRARSR